MSNKGSMFWIGYSDLMTSLFFVVLVLFVIIVSILTQHDKSTDAVIKENETLKIEVKRLSASNDSLKAIASSLKKKLDATQGELDKIHELNKSIENIDQRYFKYDESFKRHTLKDIEVSFKKGSSNINDIPEEDRTKLLNAGESIREFMQRAKKEIPDAKYMLIVEGQSSKDNYPKNYELSYTRALSLVKMWTKNKIDLNRYGNCEVIISGSGCNSSFRDLPDNRYNKKNQRFVIHIVPKPGVIK